MVLCRKCYMFTMVPYINSRPAYLLRPIYLYYLFYVCLLLQCKCWYMPSIYYNILQLKLLLINALSTVSKLVHIRRNLSIYITIQLFIIINLNIESWSNQLCQCITYLHRSDNCKSFAAYWSSGICICCYVIRHTAQILRLWCNEMQRTLENIPNLYLISCRIIDYCIAVMPHEHSCH